MGGELTYTAIGDSLTVGVGVSLCTPDFVEHLEWRLGRCYERNVSLNVFAEKGDTTDDVRRRIQASRAARDAIFYSDVITITAGGNDLIQATKQYIRHRDERVFDAALKNAKQNLTKLLYFMMALKKYESKPYVLALVNLYNPFPSIPLARRWVAAFNHALRSFRSYPFVCVADVYNAFSGRERSLLALDHIHPNAGGYEVIADCLCRDCLGC